MKSQCSVAYFYCTRSIRQLRRVTTDRTFQNLNVRRSSEESLTPSHFRFQLSNSFMAAIKGASVKAVFEDIEGGFVVFFLFEGVRDGSLTFVEQARGGGELETKEHGLHSFIRIEIPLKDFVWGH